MALEVRQLTPDLLPAFEDLFAGGGPAGRCWCMYWRIGADYRKQSADDNRRAFQAVVEDGPPPGLLALSEGIAVGWCQITPRQDLPRLGRSRILAAVDDAPVWSISCFYIRRGHRRRGVATALIRAALERAEEAGAPAVEAYPLDPGLTPSSSFTGYSSTFERLGFREVARHSPARPIMRFEFKGE